MRTIAPLPAMLALLILQGTALPHGGQYNPGGGIPPDSEILKPRVPVPEAPGRSEMTSWERWWDANGERYVPLRARVRERDGARGRVSDDPAAPGEGDGPTGRAFVAKFVLPVLTAALRDGDAEVRSAAALALGKAGFPRSLMDLQGLLRDSDRDVRESAVLALGMVGDSLAADQLMGILLSPGEDERTRGFAALGLGIIGGEEGATALLAYLDPASDAKRVGGVRRRTSTVCCVLASLGLSRHGPAAAVLEGIVGGRMPDGSKAEAVERSFAIVAMGRLGNPGTLGRRGVADLLLREDREVVRQGAAVALGLLGEGKDPFEAALLRAALARAALEDRDQNTRAHAVMALGRIGGADSMPALRAALDEGSRADLPFAALALGIAKDAPSGPGLLERFRGMKDPSVRGALGLALGLLGHAPAAEDLRAAAFGKGPRNLRSHCMLALGLLGDADAAGPLLDVVTTDWDPVLKNTAGRALGLLKDRETPAQVAACAKGSSSILARGHACRILGMIGNREGALLMARFAADPRETGYLRMFAVTGLGILSERGDVPLLTEVGFDLDAETRNDPLDILAGLM